MMKPQTRVVIHAFSLAWLLALAACGGGGDGGATAAPVAEVQGLWNGSTSSSRSVTGIVLEDGSYWFLYSVPNISALIAGFVQGTGTSVNGSFTSSDAIDFNLSGQSINNATVSANYMAKQSFNGSINYANLNPTSTFTSTYNSDYEQAPNLSAAAGNYFGIASVSGSNEAITLIISAQGVVAGTGTTSGCQYGGLVVPHAKVNLYDLALVIGGGSCASGTSTMTGIAYFDSGSKRLSLAALNKTRTNGLSFVGIKP